MDLEVPPYDISSGVWIPKRIIGPRDKRTPIKIVASRTINTRRKISPRDISTHHVRITKDLKNEKDSLKCLLTSRSMGSKGLVKGGLKFGGGISSTTSISTLSLSSKPDKFLSDSIGSMSFAVDNNLFLTSGGSSSSGEKSTLSM
jgi:hypothetical protein